MMNLMRCENGHFYDAEKFGSCPHCSRTTGSIAANPMVFSGNVGDDNGTVPLGGNTDSLGMSPGIRQNQADSDVYNRSNFAMVRGMDGEDDGKTVYFKEDQFDPVVGWLVCIKGVYFGESFKLKTGRNFIGRASNMDIALSRDNSVSRDKHAIVLYEPHKREFLAQPGESRGLFYLNDEVVLATERLRDRDILTIGNTKLMFIPYCGPECSWEDIEKANSENTMV